MFGIDLKMIKGGVDLNGERRFGHTSFRTYFQETRLLDRPMHACKTLFAQLMDFLPWTTFTRFVTRYRGNYRVRTLSCTKQFRCMDFAQLTYRENCQCVINWQMHDIALNTRQHQTDKLPYQPELFSFL